MRKFELVFIVAVSIVCSFMAGYNYYQPREVIVDRWHEPLEPIVKIVETTKIIYEPLPEEYVDAAIFGLKRAIYSHQYYIDHEDVSEGSVAWHQKCIDKYNIAINALEDMRVNK